MLQREHESEQQIAAINFTEKRNLKPPILSSFDIFHMVTIHPTAPSRNCPNQMCTKYLHIVTIHCRRRRE